MTESNIIAYLQRNREKHLEQLKRFLQYPSISTLQKHKKDIFECARYLQKQLCEIGLEHVTFMETEGNPILYADWLHEPNKPTVLVYGHYDVQPVDPLELWEFPPFEPTIINNRIYARGASDNKGQLFLHLKIIEAFMTTTGKLPFNVKVCLEGEEEIGSPSFPGFLHQNEELLKADFVLISDTAMLGENKPSVCYGLRGLLEFQLEVKGPQFDVPSGLYGGAINNPIHALVTLLSTMHDEDGRISIVGFYDQVLMTTPEEIEAFSRLPHDDKEMTNSLGVPELFGEKGYTTIERIWTRPTLEVNAISGGFQGEGIKTIIPSVVSAKVTCRLVPNQNPEILRHLIEEHVRLHQPHGVNVSVKFYDAALPYVASLDHPLIQLAAKSYEKAYGVNAFFIRAGGSIPVVETFARMFDVPVVLMGFGLPNSNVHGPNEFFSLENFDKGLLTLYYFLKELEQVC